MRLLLCCLTLSGAVAMQADWLEEFGAMEKMPDVAKARSAHIAQWAQRQVCLTQLCHDSQCGVF